MNWFKRKEKTMFKLGVMVTDKASGLKGCLTHMQIQGSPDNNATFYNFQPASLDSETGQPSDRSWLTADRVDGPTAPDPELPVNALGTKANDSITGFSGVVTALILHHSGCVHAEVQPKGSHAKNGKMLQASDFDIRLLRGPAFPEMSETEREASQKKKPSPSACGRPGPRSM